jgi:hypothetical protein
MTSINIKLTTEEVELLASLASDQIFRREFIDPKMPGHRANPGALKLGKQLVERLQGITDEAKGPRATRKNSQSVKLSGSAVNNESGGRTSVDSDTPRVR